MVTAGLVSGAMQYFKKMKRMGKQMRPVKILTDSCSDLSKDLREKYNIDYARMKTVHNNAEQWASLDFEYYTPKELYDIMRSGERVLTTQVPEQEFERIFALYLDEGFDIVYIGCSLKLSGSVNTGKMVAEKLKEKYDGAQIYCIDSLNSCLAEGILAMRAACLSDEGLNAKEINERILSERNNVNMFCTVHSLDTLKRAGRVKGSAAFFGNLFGVKPIIISDKNGNNTPIKKVKGRVTSLNEIVSLLKESLVDSQSQCIYVAHADCKEEADTVAELIKKEIVCSDVHVSYIGPIIGASVGPDAIAVFGYGKEVTFEG